MKTIIIGLLAVVLCSYVAGCTTTKIQKPDGTTISHSSLFENTKNVAMTDGTTTVIIGEQIISVGELADAAASAFLQTSTKEVNTP